MLNAVILAAGKAERMGELKQLLKWEDNNTLLGKAVDNLIDSAIIDQKIAVVIGAESNLLRKYLKKNYKSEIDNKKIKILLNSDYQQGMMSSIKTALEGLKEESDFILFTLADKPFIKAEIYQELYREFLETKPQIFLPEYKGQNGHPVIIAKNLKTKVMQLKGKRGLRNLFSLIPEAVYHYQCNYQEITIDIDSKEDYLKYYKIKKIINKES